MALVDRAASGWLTRTGGSEQSCEHELAILRRLVLFSSFALFCVPLILSFVTTPAIALPVGVATVFAAFLFSAVGSIALSRMTVAMPENAMSDQNDLFLQAAAGLALFFDAQGNVTAFGGRDHVEYLAWMRSPRARGFIEQVHVSDRILFVQAFDQLRQGENGLTIDLRLDRPVMQRETSQFTYVRLDMTARRDTEAAFIGVVGQLRDISAEQALRDDAARKTVEAESANDAKSRFLAAVSHELRTPLNAVLGFSDILIGEYFGRLENDRQREYVGLIRQSGAHLLSVVNSMLDMSKIEAGRYELMPEPFAIADSVRACECMLGLQAREKGITLTSRIQRGLGEVVADQRAIQQVLINLVGNAIKFTDAGGIVSIDASASDGILSLSISDTGIGIAADKLEMLGQPFMQVQNDYTRRYEGTGLGLSLVKGLVKLHGGSFAIASTAGEGTVITIAIPVDGSAIVSAGDTTDSHETVEFPPRLKSAVGPGGQHEEGTFYGSAKAKSA